MIIGGIKIARKGTTKYKSNKQEKKVANDIGGRTQIGSGSLWFAPSDVREEDFLIECKTTQNDYYILSYKTWEKIVREAIGDSMRIPLMHIQLEDGVDEIVIMSFNDFKGLDIDRDRIFLGGKEPLLLDRKSFRVTSDFTKQIPEEEVEDVYNCRQDVKLIDYDIHLVMLEWTDFIRIMNEGRGEIE